MDKFPLTFAEADAIAAEWGTPVYLYDETLIDQFASEALAFPAPYGLTVRYAMKAAPNATLLRIFQTLGLGFDASSGPEVERLLRAGIHPSKISLSAQEVPSNLADLVQEGISFNACSLRQLQLYGEAHPGSDVGLRFNPGLGSGSTNRTNVGGTGSSFGIWHEQTGDVRAILNEFSLNPFRVHSHIGSGTDPGVWERAAQLTLDLVAKFDTVTHMNLGGGYKVARVSNEQATDLQEIGQRIHTLLSNFADSTGRLIHLEIEPGTYLLANAGALLTSVMDTTHTGPEGYHFIKLNSGMTEILRPSLYGSQHPIEILQKTPSGAELETLVVGHCCESGDILTPAPGDPEALAPRKLPVAQPGDYCLIGGTGAYCAAMPAKNYNSFPEAPEVLRRTDGTWVCIRKRQTLDQIMINEIDPVDGIRPAQE